MISTLYKFSFYIVLTGQTNVEYAASSKNSVNVGAAPVTFSSSGSEGPIAAIHTNPPAYSNFTQDYKTQYS